MPLVFGTQIAFRVPWKDLVLGFIPLLHKVISQKCSGSTLKWPWTFNLPQILLLLWVSSRSNSFSELAPDLTPVFAPLLRAGMLESLAEQTSSRPTLRGILVWMRWFILWCTVWALSLILSLILWLGSQGKDGIFFSGCISSWAPWERCATGQLRDTSQSAPKSGIGGVGLCLVEGNEQQWNLHSL